MFLISIFLITWVVQKKVQSEVQMCIKSCMYFALNPTTFLCIAIYTAYDAYMVHTGAYIQSVSRD